MPSAASASAIALRRVQIFGLLLETDFPFTAPLPAAAGPPDLRLTLAGSPAAGGALPPPLFATEVRSAASPGDPLLAVHRLPGHDLLRFAGVADFLLSAEESDGPAGRIACHLVSPAALAEAEAWLLGTVLAWWLERTGIPALHAAAVAASGRAVAFLAFSRRGKSTLAAGLLTQGRPEPLPPAVALLSDDLLPVEEMPDGSFRARPSYPQLRLWPASAERFVEEAEELPRVHPEIDKRHLAVDAVGFAFHPDPCPLGRLYLPERRPPDDPDSGIRIAPVRPRDAVIELVRHSFLPRLTMAAGLQERRLALFARLVRRVPVRRLAYPSGFEHLPAVRDALLADLEDG